MRYRQIVFDIDGTLIDTEYAVLHSLQDTVAALTGKKILVSELTFALFLYQYSAILRRYSCLFRLCQISGAVEDIGVYKAPTIFQNEALKT